MLHFKKLSIGLRPDKKMFRIRSDGPRIVDALVAEQPGRKPDDQQYDQVVNPSVDRYVVRTVDQRDSILLDIGQIAYTKHIYDTPGSLHTDKVLDEFSHIWATISRQLKVAGIRMIGMVAEHRIFEVSSASALLLKHLTKLDGGSYPAKFVLTFERRTPRVSPPSGSPDFSSIEFSNAITAIYDSARDDSVPVDDAINANLDVQHYLTPVPEVNVIDVLKRVRREFDVEWREFGTLLSKLELVQK